MALIDVSPKFWRFCFPLMSREIVLQRGWNLTSQQMDVAFPRFDKTKTTADMTEIIKTGQQVYRMGRSLMTCKSPLVKNLGG